MRFMMLVKSDMSQGMPPKALMDAIGAATAGALESGAMVLTGGLAPPAMSTRIQVRRGEVTTTDGPFAEAKEVIGGFAVFEFASKREAVAAAEQFMHLHRVHWPSWSGETEVREILTCTDPAPPA
jgi:hypothetical protein